MFMRKLSGAIAVVGLMLFIMLAVSTNSVHAQVSHPLDSFWVDPAAANFDSNNASVGTRFNVTMWAYMEANTFAWQVTITFDPTLLQEVATGYTGTSTSQFFVGHVTQPTPPVVDNTAGTVLLGESLLGADAVTTTQNASLMWTEFEISQAPNATNGPFTCVLGINSSDTKFLNTDVMTITTTNFDGAYSFTYAAAVPLAIQSATQVPDKTNVLDDEDVVVSANVTGGTGGVAVVTLSYSTDNVAFTNTTTTLNSTTGLWDGTIPGYAAGTTVYYKIIAKDGAGNYAVKTDSYFYDVVPEFTSVLIIVMLIAMTSAVLLMRKKIMR
jgi:hypothetical protein